MDQLYPKESLVPQVETEPVQWDNERFDDIAFILLVICTEVELSMLQSMVDNPSTIKRVLIAVSIKNQTDYIKSKGNSTIEFVSALNLPNAASYIGLIQNATDEQIRQVVEHTKMNLPSIMSKVSNRRNLANR